MPGNARKSTQAMSGRKKYEVLLDFGSGMLRDGSYWFLEFEIKAASRDHSLVVFF
jgi:hypothetical protein